MYKCAWQRGHACMSEGRGLGSVRTSGEWRLEHMRVRERGCLVRVHASTYEYVRTATSAQKNSTTTWMPVCGQALATLGTPRGGAARRHAVLPWDTPGGTGQEQEPHTLATLGTPGGYAVQAVSPAGNKHAHAPATLGTPGSSAVHRHTVLPGDTPGGTRLEKEPHSPATSGTPGGCVVTRRR